MEKASQDPLFDEHVTASGTHMPIAQIGSTLRFVSVFALAANDHLKVANSLEMLCVVTGARSAILTRIFHDAATPRLIARSGRSSNSISTLRSIPPSQMQCGSTQLVEQPDSKDGTGACTLLITLSWKDHLADLIELQFSARPGPQTLELLTHLASEAAHVWSQRRSGLVSTLMAAHTRRTTREIEPAHRKILDQDNPYGLSRSEYRVCAYLREGLKPAEIAEGLDVSITTVRSHLRGIYAKTGLAGQVEVLHRMGQDELEQYREPTRDVLHETQDRAAG